MTVDALLDNNIGRAKLCFVGPLYLAPILYRFGQQPLPDMLADFPVRLTVAGKGSREYLLPLPR